ncbi:MAG: hypothetical protein KAI29_16775 [Cyclobacteriaceae bacterium]|nr:hypothetical protein [Cyclobacteriaceae bacterium]
MDSSEIIEERLMANLSSSELDLLQFEIAYNKSNLMDLFEATSQDLQTDISRFWRILGSIEVLPDWFADIMNVLVTQVDEEALVTTDSLKDQLFDYKTKIAEGKKVLLVAHSQGNFFGNQAYGLLSTTERESFGMVSVANPDSFVAGDGPYTILINDGVIWAVIFVKTLAGLPQLPMDPYMENSLGDLNDILGHSFINAYMVAGSNSDQKITSDMISVLDNLTKPYKRLEPGVITVTLIWEGATDIDLHVFEPYGSHVYWEAGQGFSGFLDRDDRSGYGPEHYTVPSCDTLQFGTYEIGLDYFKGDYPEVAHVQVEAGLKVRFFEVSMPSEYYGSPSYPVILARVRLVQAENGEYEFKIF